MRCGANAQNSASTQAEKRNLTGSRAAVNQNTDSSLLRITERPVLRHTARGTLCTFFGRDSMLARS